MTRQYFARVGGRLVFLAWLVFLACYLAGCDRVEPNPRNVVLVVVDTLRADHLGTYGYTRDTSPHIDAFARQSLVFEQARSQAPCTYPSVNSLLTSRPTSHLKRAFGFAIPSRMPTLATILHGRGWRTAAVSASPIVRGSPGPLNPTGGFDRGFESFDEQCEKESAECVNGAARKLLAEFEEPFLLYLHYMDVHAPYLPPAEHVRRFTESYDGFEFVAAGDPQPLAKMLYRNGPTIDLQDADLRHLIDLYDEGIRYFDARFGELLEELDELELSDRTIVALVSDHGEEFLEHGDALHCRNLYDTQIRTPLILRVPGEEPARITANAQNLDVVPTLLDYLGVGPTLARLYGRSLRPVKNGDAPGGPVFASWKWSHSVVDGHFKLIVHRESGSSQLFDLERDPAELNDLSSQRPDTVARLRGLIDQWFSKSRSPGAESVPDDRAEQQLRALGYIE